jgi:broad specificity phosphatase PhoE
MTTRFVLVRHAACAPTDTLLLGRTVDAPLDARGRTQASAVATQLASARPALVASSPRLRARQTAVAIAGHAACAMRISDELDEVDFGRWAGSSFAELARDPQWQRWNARRAVAATPAGDTMARVRERAMCCLRSLADEFDGHAVVVVTHAEVIRTLLLHARRWPLSTWLRIDVAPASAYLFTMHDAELRSADKESLAA